MEIYVDEFASLAVSQEGQVATIRMRGAVERASAGEMPSNNHWELGELISRMRGRTDIRVLVLTGFTDGVFKQPAPSEEYAIASKRASRNDPKRMWRSFTGITRVIEGITSIEKPVIAKVNGDAIGFGQSVMFACDLIVAREDARIIDHHMGNGEGGKGSPYGLVPGDGGAGLVPSYFSPARAKEYLMLGRVYTAAELCALGLINYAVPSGELDARTDELVEQLIARSAYALAWTKRVANKMLVAEVNLRHDASAAYEMVSSYQAERMDWQSSDTLG